jgi:choline dehydrogenase-like flavoprotein
MMEPTPDVLIIGSGVGGGAMARRLAENGARVLLIERGGWVPPEAENWSVASVFHEKRYTAHDTWLDADGAPFRPNMYYNVGGCTKFYGGSMIRLRQRDFETLAHAEGESPAWPIRYADLEPYYCQAEKIFGVHGNDQGDPTAPWRSIPTPFPSCGPSLVLRAWRMPCANTAPERRHFRLRSTTGMEATVSAAKLATGFRASWARRTRLKRASCNRRSTRGESR